jgi:hypothetical protein
MNPPVIVVNKASSPRPVSAPVEGVDRPKFLKKLEKIDGKLQNENYGTTIVAYAENQENAILRFLVAKRGSFVSALLLCGFLFF